MSDFDEIRAICERQAAKAKPGKSSTCGTCSGDGLMWWPWLKYGKPDWYVLQCHCGQADVASHVPIWSEFRRRDGRPPARSEVYSSDERSQFDTLVAEMKPHEEGEPDYSFDGNVG